MKGLKQCLLFPKFNCGCALVTLALALAWPARAADPVLIGQGPGWPRGGGGQWRGGERELRLRGG